MAASNLVCGKGEVAFGVVDAAISFFLQKDCKVFRWKPRIEERLSFF
jgi:hypothetical protein